MAAVSPAWFSNPPLSFTPPAVAPGPRPCAAPALPPRRVVALTDFSAPATNAVWRAALAARDLALPLHIVGLRSAAAYRRVMVSVDLEAQACDLIAAARSLSRDPRMQVLHVLHGRHQTRMLLADVPAKAVRRHSEQAADAARRTLARMIAAAGAAADGAVPVTAFGHVATTMLRKERRARVQLLVLGQPPRGALADLVLGGVARWLLPATQADVLLVPLAPRGSAVPGGAVPKAGTP